MHPKEDSSARTVEGSEIEKIIKFWEGEKRKLIRRYPKVKSLAEKTAIANDNLTYGIFIDSLKRLLIQSKNNPQCPTRKNI